MRPQISGLSRRRLGEAAQAQRRRLGEAAQAHRMVLEAAESENAQSNLLHSRLGEPVRPFGIEDSRSQSVARAVKNAYVEKLVRWQSLAFPLPLYVPSRAGLVLLPLPRALVVAVRDWRHRLRLIP